MEQEYIVVLNRDVDVEQFHQEMKNVTGSGVIPNREVVVSNERPGSKRQFNYMLTFDEVDWLRKDSRVAGVTLKNNPFVINDVNAVRTSLTFNKTINVDNNYSNWGLVRSNTRDNPFDLSGELQAQDDKYNYINSGENVDVVVMDTGIQVDHPEFLDKDGNPRIQQIDWPSAAGLPDLTQPANFYEDLHGHGTHVASTIAGLNYGWAPGAKIYAMTINLVGVSNGFEPLDGLELILNWHRNKGNDRPTIVNMSWGQSSLLRSQYVNLFRVTYRNNDINWNLDETSRANLWRTTGLLDMNAIITSENPNNYTLNDITFPSRNSAYDDLIDEMIDEGMHVCISSGNLPVKHEATNGPDWDNRVVISAKTNNNPYGILVGNYYFFEYHRGGSPHSDRAIKVDSLGFGLGVFEDGSTIELAASYNTRGPGVDIMAPGNGIIAGLPNTPNNVDPVRISTYPFDSNYKIGLLNGTSMACPQVTGAATLSLGVDPNLTPKELKDRILVDSTKNAVYDTVSAVDYNEIGLSLMGQSNRVLYNRFGETGTVGTFENIGYVNIE